MYHVFINIITFYLRPAFLFKALVIGISFSQGKVKLGRVNGEFESADSKLLDKCSQIQRKSDLGLVSGRLELNGAVKQRGKESSLATDTEVNGCFSTY